MIEVMYHENVHSKSKNISLLKEGTKEYIMMETCTQLYAREKYASILKKYGKTPEHYLEIKYNGLGYRDLCDALRPFFEKEGKMQIGELINIANLENDGYSILMNKLIKLGMTKEESEDYLISLIFGD